jgi:plasmid replication initiation protein
MKTEVYKHNSIIGVSSTVTLQDARYIQTCLGGLYKKELLEKDVWYGIDVNYYSQQCGISKIQAYQEFREIASSLRVAKVTIPIDEQKTLEVGWITAILYNDKDLTIAVQWNEHVIPFISGLSSGNYTILHESSVTLSSINSIRLYEILKRAAYKKALRVKLDELQEQLGVNYKLFGDFNAKLLQPKLKEINNKTDICVRMFPKKIGKKVESLYFEIDKKELTVTREKGVKVKETGMLKIIGK